MKQNSIFHLFSVDSLRYRGFYENCSLSYLSALGIDRQSPLTCVHSKYFLYEISCIIKRSFLPLDLHPGFRGSSFHKYCGGLDSTLWVKRQFLQQDQEGKQTNTVAFLKTVTRATRILSAVYRNNQKGRQSVSSAVASFFYSIYETDCRPPTIFVCIMEYSFVCIQHK